MKISAKHLLCTTILLVISTNALLAAEVEFQKIHLDPTFRSEGASVADFNGDGQNDIAVGSVYYAAPDWKMVPIYGKADTYDLKTTWSDTFGTAAEDLDHDGDVDLIQLPWPGAAAYWWENPGKDVGDASPKEAWKRHLIASVLNNESPHFVDIDGDGLGEIIGGYTPDPKKLKGSECRLVILKRTRDARQPWKRIDVSPLDHPASKRYSHGLGVGDVNRDGRNDIVTKYGWWEQPGDGIEGDWIYHELDLGREEPHTGAHVIVADFDGDDDTDFFITSAHHAGTWWYEQTKPNVWVKHTLDDKITQLHAVCMADINADGRPDIVTGKRWYAHNGRDPGSQDPAVLLWWENGRDSDGKIVWRKHFIDNSGVGNHFTVKDVNGDGKLDIATSNKKGAHLFLQK